MSNKKLLFPGKKISPLKHLGFALILCLLMGTTACNNSVNLDWQPKIVSPLISGELGVFQQPDVQDISDSFIITANDVFGTQRGTLPSLPALGAFNFPLNPSKISNDNTIESVGLSNIKITVTLKNNMPVTMASGAIITLTNSGETATFVEQTIAQEVAPGETLNITIEKSTGVLKNIFSTALNNVSTVASNSTVTIADDSQIELSIKFDTPTVDYIQFIAGTSSVFETTNDFDVGIDQNTESISGNLIVNLDNKVSLDVTLSIDLLDSEGSLLASIFSPSLSLAANQSTSQTLTSQTLLDNLKIAKKLRIRASFNPTAQNNKIENAARLIYKIIADLQIKVKVK